LMPNPPTKQKVFVFGFICSTTKNYNSEKDCSFSYEFIWSSKPLLTSGMAKIKTIFTAMSNHDIIR
jgi:hypothetical protein